MGKSIKRNVESKTANSKCCALVIDESTSAINAVQLAIFIWGIDDEYNVTTVMAALVPLKYTTQVLYFYGAVKITFKWLSLSLINIWFSYLYHLGDGKKEGLTKLIDDVIATGNSHLMKYHCIQENLCAKALKIDSAMQIIIDVVNCMKSNGLNHHQHKCTI